MHARQLLDNEYSKNPHSEKFEENENQRFLTNSERAYNEEMGILEDLNPSQYGFNMIDKIFDTSNGVIRDNDKTLQLKSLRNEISKLRVSDAKLLPKVIVKISEMSSISFLLKLKGFEKFCKHYCKKFNFEAQIGQEQQNDLSSSRKHVRLVEEMVKDCFLNLEDLWKQLFVSHRSKLNFLKNLSRSGHFSRYFQNLNQEIEHLLKLKEVNSRAVELMDLREMLRSDFDELTCHYKDLKDVKIFNRDEKVNECVYQIRRVSKDILSYLRKFDPNNHNLLIKYYGIGMDVIAKLDLWEIDYVTNVQK